MQARLRWLESGLFFLKGVGKKPLASDLLDMI
jgi:hypothetical protein